MMELHESEFEFYLKQQGVSLTQQQQQQFKLYFETLVEWNKKVNLTAITQKKQVYIKHFYDAISPSFFVNINTLHNLADIGSGAGFPALPLKICFPHLQITIIDCLQKRITFLQHLTSILRLTDIQLVHGRAEQLAREKQYRDKYDLVTARAVAKLAVLNELCLPFVKKEGIFVAMKGPTDCVELKEANFSCTQLKSSVSSTHQLQLPFDYGERNIIVIQKKGATPSKYPRKTGIPAKKPLLNIQQ